MKTFRLLVLLLVAGAFIDLYFGVPVSIGSTPKYWTGSVEREVQRLQLRNIAKQISTTSAAIGLPTGRIAFAPTLEFKQELGIRDAFTNLLAIVAGCLFMFLFELVASIIEVTRAVSLGDWWGALWWVFLLLVAPLLSLLASAPFLTGLIFEESTTAYFLVFLPLAIVAWIPTIAITLGLIGLFFGGVGGILDSGAGVAETGSSGGPVAPTRINPRSGIVQTKGLFWWNDTNERINLRTGVLQKRGLFWWKDK